MTKKNLPKIQKSKYPKIPALRPEPTSNGYLIEVTERLHHYSGTNRDLKKLLPSNEKNKNMLKIQKSKFPKILTLGSEPTPTGYVTEVTERLHHYSSTSSDLKKLLNLIEKKFTKNSKI